MKYLSTSLRISLGFMLMLAIYYGIITLAGSFSAGKGGGEKISYRGRVVGYANLGQNFSGAQFFQGRPSAVDNNAAGSGGSNKGTTNPEYLALVQTRIDSLLAQNPGLTKDQIPAELVTASGSGLDPDISPMAASIQVKRVSAATGVAAGQLDNLIKEQTQTTAFGPSKINVLKLNIALQSMVKN